ncbi:MAG: hypothetical protein R3C25_12825 [Hyphomonadaceae bacterium]
MLIFLWERKGLAAAATLIALLAAAAAWSAQPLGQMAAALIGAMVLVLGLLVVGLARAFWRTRLAFRRIEAQQEQTEQLRVAGDALRTRLALAERRLAALAIKLDASDELDNPE